MPRHKRGWGIKDDDHRKKRQTPLMVSLVEPALLLLIEQEPRHGYALHEALKGFGVTPIHPSVVYRTLKQMEELGWINAEWDTEAGQGPPRKVFRISEDGQVALQRWLKELVKVQSSIERLIALSTRERGVRKKHVL